MMRTLTIGLTAAGIGLLLFAEPTRAGTIAYDDFDGSNNLNSRVVDPDLSGNDGFFPTDDRFDIFGITNRAAAEDRNSFDILDDSAGSFAPDTFGILKTGKTDNVFGAADLANGDNPDGLGSVVWEFDISSATGPLEVAIDFAAMGNFESSNDSFDFTASIDGGPAQALFISSVDENATKTYTLESGNTNNIDDPLLMNGMMLDNNFQTLIAPLSGTGSVLTLTLEASSNGGSEVFVFDNLQINQSLAVIPEPSSIALAGLGLAGALGLAARRRRARA